MPKLKIYKTTVARAKAAVSKARAKTKASRAATKLEDSTQAARVTCKV